MNLEFAKCSNKTFAWLNTTILLLSKAVPPMFYLLKCFGQQSLKIFINKHDQSFMLNSM